MIWDFYHAYGRDLAWRRNPSPYVVAVTEIMLQQTQVERVKKKYPEWMAQFPDFKWLAEAPLPVLLNAWQGMGYNRRAIALQKIAQKVMQEYNGQLPKDPEILVTFPGIGKATAGSIAAFAYQVPATFIETNIRRVYIDYFFKDHEQVDDKDIAELVAATVDMHNPREWYYALMDYGATLPKTKVNPNRKSKSYRVQSKFEGSNRQLRGRVIAYMLKNNKEPIACETIAQALEKTAERIMPILEALTKEQFLIKKDGEYFSINS